MNSIINKKVLISMLFLGFVEESLHGTVSQCRTSDALYSDLESA